MLKIGKTRSKGILHWDNWDWRICSTECLSCLDNEQGSGLWKLLCTHIVCNFLVGVLAIGALSNFTGVKPCILCKYQRILCISLSKYSDTLTVALNTLMAVIFGAYTCASSIPASIPSQRFSLQCKLYDLKVLQQNPQDVYYTLAECNWAFYGSFSCDF